MLTIELIVRDEHGVPVDVADIGVAGLVKLIRARPPDETGGPPGGTGIWGAALASLEVCEQVTRRVAAVRAACVSAVGDECPDGPAGCRVLDELACSLLVSRRSAMHTRNVAETVRAVPRAWSALARGELDQTRAQILSDAVLEIPRFDPDGTLRPQCEAERAALLDDGLPYAREHTARRLALFLRRRLTAMGCDQPARRRRAIAERGVWVSHDGEGTADLTARLSSEDAERVYSIIRATALADRNGDPTHDCTHPREPMDTWLAAAFVDLVLGGAGLGRRPDPGPAAAGTTPTGASDPAAGIPARVGTVVNVTIPIDSLAGLSEEPGVLNGVGVIPADVARRLAAGDARWRRILVCRTSGAVLDVGTLSYRPPAALDRHVRLRDGTCRFPGCEVPARECDLDHLVPFPAGPTSADNLHALCRRHHGLKHEGGWRVEALPGQALRWSSPQGAVAVSRPDDSLRAIA